MDEAEEALLKPVQYSEESHALFIDILPRLLDDWVASASEVPAPASPQRFQGAVPPPLTISAYVLRIAKLTRCSAVCLLAAYVYLERIVEDHAVLVTRLTVHRHAPLAPGLARYAAVSSFPR